jgi:hypothetical protein
MANNAALADCISWAACRLVFSRALASKSLSVMPFLNVTNRFLIDNRVLPCRENNRMNHWLLAYVMMHLQVQGCALAALVGCAT